MYPLHLSNNAVKVLGARYLLHKHGEQETPEEMFRRVARTVSAAEQKWDTKAAAARWEEQFFDMMTSLLFLPNSPTLMNAGTSLGQLSACFVLPVEDSLEEIFTSLKDAALIQQSGGGTGFNFSHLRPKNAPLSIIGGKASGPVSFMKIFNAATEYVKHGGKRRGANMGILNVDHPDIEEFIRVKDEKNTLNNFNLSVGISDAFMKAVKSGTDWPLASPATSKPIRSVQANILWQEIVEHAWKTGDPGLVFLDTLNKSNPLPALGRIECTNPCGEVPLLPYESCNLGSIDLARFVRSDRSTDWNKLREVIFTAVRFLDDVIEVCNYILPQSGAMAHNNRKIGLGIMGWAGMLMLKQIPYDSQAAITAATELGNFLQTESLKASALLARERGTFPNWDKSIYYPLQPVRNATRLSIAPTGTISIIADTTPSIEPVFALAYQRKHILQNEMLNEVNEVFIDYLKEFDLYSPDIVEQVQMEGSVKDTALPPEVKQVFKTALEISPEWHLKHQAVFQQYVDNAVSKTINLPADASVEEVEQIYTMAWQQQLKGITVYRQQSKETQVLHPGIAHEPNACMTCPP